MKTLTPLLRQKLQIVLVFISIAAIPCVAFSLEPIATIGQIGPKSHAFLTNDTLLRVVPTHIEVVDTDTGEVIDEFGKLRYLNDAVFSPTNSHAALLSYSRDTEKTIINIWDVNAREQINALEIEGRIFDKAAFSPTQPIFVFPIAREIYLWNWQNGEIVGKLIRENMSSEQALVFTPDGNHLIISTRQPGIEVWDVETRQLQGWYKKQITHRLNNLTISPDGTTVAAFEENSNSRLIYVWDVGTQELLWREISGIGRISDAVFSPDSQRLYVASQTGALQRTGATPFKGWDDKVRVWDVKSGQQLDTFGPSFHDLEAITLSPDGQTVLLQYFDAVVLWDIAQKKQQRVWTDFIGNPWSIGGLSPDGKTVVVVSPHSIKTWNVTSRRMDLFVSAGDYMFEEFTISPDSQKIAIGKSPWLELRDIQTGKVETRFPHHITGANQTTFSPSGRWIVVVDSRRDLLIFDVKNPDKIHRVRPRVEQETANLYRTAFSENGEYLVASGETGRNNQEKYWILLWKREGDTFEFQYAWNIPQWDTSLAQTLTLASTEDGTTVVAVAGLKNTQIWEILPNTAQLVTTLLDTNAPIHFSADKRYLLTDGSDDELQIWHWQTNTPINHPSILGYWALSQDGSALASYSMGRCRIWDATKILPSHSELTAVEPKGKQLVTLGQIKRAQLLQNFPNPFNPETWIPFRLATESLVTIRIYTPTGKLVRTLSPGLMSAGAHASQEKAVHWDGRNDAGEQVSSGVYLYTINAGDFSDTRKMLIKK